MNCGVGGERGTVGWLSGVGMDTVRCGTGRLLEAMSSFLSSQSAFVSSSSLHSLLSSVCFLCFLSGLLPFFLILGCLRSSLRSSFPLLRVSCAVLGEGVSSCIVSAAGSAVCTCMVCE